MKPNELFSDTYNLPAMSSFNGVRITLTGIASDITAVNDLSKNILASPFTSVPVPLT